MLCSSVRPTNEPLAFSFLPYLLGERSPRWNEKAKGSFVGLTLEHNTGDMLRAVMEGVAFMLRKNCDHIRAKGTEISYIIATLNHDRSLSKLLSPSDRIAQLKERYEQEQVAEGIKLV